MLNKNEMKSGMAAGEAILLFEDMLNASQADLLKRAGMVKEEALTGLADDYGILDAFLSSRLNNQQFKAIRNTKPQIFLTAIASQSFGAGILTQFRIKSKGSSLSEFTKAEIEGLKKYLSEQDPYFMACTLLDAHPGTEDKEFLDSMVTGAISVSMNSVGERLFEDDYLRAFAGVLYDTGITLASI